jgi:hypothetical protein
MDQEALKQFETAGVKIDLASQIPFVAVALQKDQENPIALGGTFPVSQGEDIAVVTLKPISQLFAGNRPAPNLSGEPPPEYQTFLLMIESAVFDYCRAAARAPYDEEFEKLYLHLRRRPDDQHADPLFSYMQAGARLYMSLVDVSRAEFEAIAQRLTRSARHFRTDAASRNYFEIVGEQLDQI